MTDHKEPFDPSHNACQDQTFSISRTQRTLFQSQPPQSYQSRDDSRESVEFTLEIDDAGVGDLLFGVVIGAHRRETGEFQYDIIPVSFFQEPDFKKKLYLKKATELTNNLLDKMKLGNEETIEICSSFLFDETRPALWDQYGKERVKVTQIVGQAQDKVELAYIDEIRNLGYEPITERDDKRAKSFFHMLGWVKKDPGKRFPYAKTGWPRLKNYLTVAQKRWIYSSGLTRDQDQSSRQN